MKFIRAFIQASGVRLGVLVGTAAAWTVNASAQLPTQADPDSGAVRDGNIITSRKPDDLPAFVVNILQALQAAKLVPTGVR